MTMVMEDVFDRGAISGRFVWMIDLHNLGMGDLDPRVATGAVPLLMQHQVGRLGQAVLLDAPFIFGMFWSAVTPLLDQPTADRVMPLSAANMPSYFEEHLTPKQARFMTEVLAIRATPGAYPPAFAGAFARRTPFRIPLEEGEELCREGAAESEGFRKSPALSEADGENDIVRIFHSSLLRCFAPPCASVA